MADLEAVLADVSYLMAMEKSKATPAARASKKIILPDPRWVPEQVGLGNKSWWHFCRYLWRESADQTLRIRLNAFFPRLG